MGKKLYSIEGNTLSVSFRRFGKSHDYKFELDSLSPDCVLRYVSFTGAWLIPAVLLAIFLIVFSLLSKMIYYEYWKFVQLLFIGPLLWRIIKGSRAVKLAQFRSNHNVCVFDVIITNREGEEFVVDLSEAVRSSQKGSNGRVRRS